MFTKIRYNRIALLSSQIDLVLHNPGRLDLGEMDEGELSILHSEITKMMQRIREQNDALKQDKIRLADSLADIAHQLRTPLTSANLILSLLSDTADENERRAFLRETEEPSCADGLADNIPAQIIAAGRPGLSYSNAGRSM